jgi:DNA polymerase-3 subunit delta
MAEISYPQLAAHLQGAARGGLPPVCLIHGEELLVRQAFEAVVNHLLPSADHFNFEALDGAAADIGDVIARVRTYALMAGTKVVALKDARVFHSQADAGRLFENARKAFMDGEPTKAAHALLGALGQVNLDLQDLADSGRGAKLPPGWDPGEDHAWLDALVDHCRSLQLEAKAAGDDAARLEEAIAKGLPAGHHLVISTDIVDRRRGLYKAIVEQGLVIDCSVPKGERKADREAQAAALQSQLKAILDPCHKTMGRAAFTALCEMTGFNLGVFTNNIEILVDFVGGRREITAADVEAALTRTKKDPLFEFTNAVTDRKWEKSIGLLGALLDGEMHALQLLAAITNQVRKLLVAKGFLESPAGAAWHPGITYLQFQSSVQPAVAQHDRELLAQMGGWEQKLAAGKPAGKRKAQAKASSDLVLAKSPASAYPLYQLLIKAERFSRDELEQALQRLSDADLQLKSSTVNPRLALERVVWSICGNCA